MELDNYNRHGFGLWMIETHSGEFVGDCGLTMQEVEGWHVEAGWHVRSALRGQGYAAGANDHLDGARRIDVIRLRGPQEVLDAPGAEARGAIG